MYSVDNDEVENIQVINLYHVICTHKQAPAVTKHFKQKVRSSTHELIVSIFIFLWVSFIVCELFDSLFSRVQKSYLQQGDNSKIFGVLNDLLTEEFTGKYSKPGYRPSSQ